MNNALRVLSFLLALIPAIASGQTPTVKEITVRGTVKDSKGEPLAGVTVKAKDEPGATFTSAKGEFTLNVSSPKSILVFSFIGYSSQQRFAGESHFVEVALKENTKEIEEVVVVAYGTQKKKDVTGSISSVSVTDLQIAPVRSFEEALGGRVAGVQVTSNDGQPGAASNIVIRGSNSVTQQNSPLYVIDGFPLENPDNNAINPSEIETIEVLKDASATALYGARGANGVIIITTKRGKSGDVKIKFDSYYGFQKVIKKQSLMNAYDFVRYQYEIATSKATEIYLTPFNLQVSDYKNLPTVDWQDRLFRVAPIQNHSLSIRGGTKQGTFSISGSINSQDGSIINSGFDRYQGRVVLDQNINPNLKVGLNLNYANSKNFGVLTSKQTSAQYNLLYNVWSYRPTAGTDNSALIDKLLDDGVVPTSDYRINPVISAANESRTEVNSTIIANTFLEYKLSRDFILRVSGGINRKSLRNELFNNSATRSGSNFVTGANNVNGGILTSYLDDYLNENTLAYNRVFNDRSALNVLVGGTIQQTKTYFNGFTSQQVPDETLGIGGIGEGKPGVISFNKSTYSLASFLGKFNYSYKSRYLVTGTFRADGSSKFALSNRWGYFPSGALAWRINQENFMKSVTAVSDLKLRASFGVTGNNRVDDFAYLSSITYPTAYGYSFNNAITNFSQAGSLGNPNLKWESTRQTDLGIDVSLLRDRITFVADYYKKLTYNLLLDASLPLSTGFASAFKNVGKVSNRGLEFSLNTINLKNKAFSWSTNFNISFNKNQIVALSENQESILTTIPWDVNYGKIPTFIAKVGQPIAQFYGYIWDGNYQYSDFDNFAGSRYILKDDVPGNGNPKNIVQPGDIKYKDLNGDGKVDANDLTPIGNPFPIHVGGFTNNFNYKGFYLNVFFQWSYGNKILDANRLTLEGNPALGINQYASYNNRWTPTNQNNTYFRYGGQGPYAISSRIVEDGSFLRLKTISIGYEFNSNFLKRVKIQSLKFYSTAQNLRTWTKYTGPDPEVSTRNSTLTPGFDYSPYPRTFTLVFGTNISF